MDQVSFKKLINVDVQKGFSILELLLVIATMSMLFALVLPNITVISATQDAKKLGTLSSDIRSAFDMAVLHKRPHRLVFHFSSGDYWLETTDRQDFFLSRKGMPRELTPDEQKDAAEFFELEFEEYVELAGNEIEDQDEEIVYPPMSPLLAAKERLMPVKWRKIIDSEWKKRELGPNFVIASMQAEHHQQLLRLEDLGERAFAYLYFFPNGYVEKAVIHIAPSDGEGRVDPEQEPYTLITDPYLGIAKLESGYKEVNIFEE